ncbi:MAG: AAA family ATPase [Chloroflexi bacterium]|nr:AAA family ATPase [Chloroflexota bacterium]
MPITIAVAGKGGTGKTTIAGLLIRYLREKNLGNVLAIDADPSSNLNAVLGLDLDGTVGDVREEMLSKVGAGALTPGIPKQDYLEYRINQVLVESTGIDLLAMGRPEGQGCYCAANNMLRTLIDRLGREYRYVVIDNEAGLEHLSRRTTRDVDILLLVTDPTMRGLTAAARVIELVDELKTGVGHSYLVVNRAEGALPSAFVEAVQKLNVEFVGTVPRDEALAAMDAEGRPLVEIPDGSPVYEAVKMIAQKMGI